MNIPPHRTRRIYLVRPDLQWRWALGVSATALCSGLLLFVEYYITFGRHAPGGPWDAELLWIFLRAHWMLFAQLIVFAGVSALLTVFYSHRVVGPLVNLRRALRRLGTGDFSTRAAFRRNDELHELAEAFNDAAESLEARETSLRRELSAIAKDPDCPEACRERMQYCLERYSPSSNQITS